MSVRVRFAPSPTGHVHIGNIRVAIFNWLFARHSGGQFLLRVEDTDRERSTPEAIEALLAAMTWLGLDVDEEPMYQSARTEAHLAVAEHLVAAGMAYRQDKGDTGKGECVIFRMPGEGKLTFEDEIKGTIKKRATDVQDFVIVRSDGSPVFHLANVVDDIAMRVTHVIRGDDHMENTFRHVALYQALGAEPPRFAHLPMIVNNQGKPYSKRDGSAFVGDFKSEGFLPAALFNFLALLGWSPGEDREVMTREEMIALFSLDRVKSNPARFDMKKLTWMNGEYMQHVERAEFTARFRAELAQAGLWDGSGDPAYLDAIVEQMHSRTKVYDEVVPSNAYFFTDDFAYDEKAFRKRLRKEGVPELLADMNAQFRQLTEFTPESTEQALRSLCDARGIEVGELVHPVRVAVSGLAVGPGLFEMLALLGQQRVVERIDRTHAMLSEG